MVTQMARSRTMEAPVVVIACLQFRTGFLTGQFEMDFPQPTLSHLLRMARSLSTNTEQAIVKVLSLITRSLAGTMLG
jgi:hypothetical protein